MGLTFERVFESFEYLRFGPGMGNGLWHSARNFYGNISTPPDCYQRDTGRDEITASWAYILWDCPDFMGVNLLPLAES